MNKLDKILEELCPNGVEYKKLSEIATITRGGNFQKKDYEKCGISCIHYGQIYTYYNLFVYETINFISEEKAKNQKMASTNDIIMAVTSENIDDVCKCIAWLGEGQIAVSGHTAIIHHTQNPKYLVYWFHTAMFHRQKRKLAHGTKVIEVTPDKLTNIIIPVPPLEVQNEIVRILDSFTELTTGLTIQLTAEIATRRKQYEYYREKVLSFGADIKKYSVKEICDTITNFAAAGSFAEVAENVPYLSEPDYAQLIRTVDIKSHYTNKSPIYISKQSFEYLWRVNLDSPSIVLPSVGNCGEVYYLDPVDLPCEHNALAKNALLVRSSKANMKFLRFIFESVDFQRQLAKVTSNMGQSKFNKKDFEKLLIPIPNSVEQERVVTVLERFETLCNDVSTDLPAEIEARQRQYEYYRDKLMTFKEKVY